MMFDDIGVCLFVAESENSVLQTDGFMHNFMLR